MFHPSFAGLSTLRFPTSETFPLVPIKKCVALVPLYGWPSKNKYRVGVDEEVIDRMLGKNGTVSSVITQACGCILINKRMNSATFTTCTFCISVCLPKAMTIEQQH
mmetsp:Transcript_81790/g.181823  ORF Transcript_81790/g.181823 Transcript_81790/m.181823 type:complete len:106 (+) Transcript_81790:105-422(+)